MGYQTSSLAATLSVRPGKLVVEAALGVATALAQGVAGEASSFNHDDEHHCTPRTERLVVEDAVGLPGRAGKAMNPATQRIKTHGSFEHAEQQGPANVVKQLMKARQSTVEERTSRMIANVVPRNSSVGRWLHHWANCL